MDEIDQKLMSLLRQDARLTVAALATKLQVSRGTVTNRIRRLEDDGVIVGVQRRKACIAGVAHVLPLLRPRPPRGKCASALAKHRAVAADALAVDVHGRQGPPELPRGGRAQPAGEGALEHHQRRRALPLAERAQLELGPQIA